MSHDLHLHGELTNSPRIPGILEDFVKREKPTNVDPENAKRLGIFSKFFQEGSLSIASCRGGELVISFLCFFYLRVCVGEILPQNITISTQNRSAGIAIYLWVVPALVLTDQMFKFADGKEGMFHSQVNLGVRQQSSCKNFSFPTVSYFVLICTFCL